MVLESLFTAKTLEKKPFDMLILSMIITLVCVFISVKILPEYAGILSASLITIGLTPVFFKIFKIDEESERSRARKLSNENFWDRHDETIILFSLFFIGNFLAVFLITLIAPQTFIATAFGNQISAIGAINGPSGAFLGSDLLSIIFLNNMRVMFFAFILSFLIGAAGLFILSWNASILAIYLGSFIREGLHQDFLLRTLGIAPHAPVEIFAYFLAVIAGGILSVGVIREKYGSKTFNLVFRDALIMLLFATLALVFGAVLEVYI